MPNALNKGAGSEASLPVTLRVRRRAPQAALFNVYAVSRRWRDRTACLSDMAACFRKQGFRACGRDQRAMKTDEVCDRPLETFGTATFGVICCLSLFVAGISRLRARVGGFAVAPDTPSQRSPMRLDFYRSSSLRICRRNHALPQWICGCLKKGAGKAKWN